MGRVRSSIEKKHLKNFPKYKYFLEFNLKIQKKKKKKHTHTHTLSLLARVTDNGNG